MEMDFGLAVTYPVDRTLQTQGEYWVLRNVISSSLFLKLPSAPWKMSKQTSGRDQKPLDGGGPQKNSYNGHPLPQNTRRACSSKEWVMPWCQAGDTDQLHRLWTLRAFRHQHRHGTSSRPPHQESPTTESLGFSGRAVLCKAGQFLMLSVLSPEGSWQRCQVRQTL